MAATFPTSPINGEYAVVNSITYVYASAQQSWTRVPGEASGGGTPGGIDTQVQYNAAGSFAASAGLTFNYTTNALATTGTVTALGNISGSYIIGNGSQLTGLPAGYANSDVAAYLASGTNTSNISGGNLTTAGILTVNSGNAVSAIVNGGGNGVGNIGSSTKYFNTVFAKATSAQYADLAEMYQGDQTYMPGTVVEFGGTHEVTITTVESSTRIAGVVSTNPSYIMNSGLTGLNSVPVALTGRVPCQVLGPVRKGDRLVSSMIPGVAQALDESTYRPGCMVGKSLDDWSESSVKLIEVVVGRL